MGYKAGGAMSSLKKRGKVWYIKFTRGTGADREYTTRSLNTNQKAVAIEKQKELDHKVRIREIDPFQPGFELPVEKPAWYSVSSCVSDYLHSRRNFAYETRRNDRYVLEKWMKELNISERPITSIKRTTDVAPFFTRDDIEPQTMESELQRFRTFWRWLMDQERVKTDETNPIKLPENTIQYVPKMITDDEFKRMIAAFKKHDKKRRKQPWFREWHKQDWFIPAVTLIYETGLRLSEVGKRKNNKKSGMQGENLIWENGEIHYIYVHRSKTNTERMVPVTKHLNRLLNEYFAIRGIPEPEEYVFINDKGQPITSRNVYNQFKKYCKLAEVPKSRTIHGMRHRRITTWVEEFTLKDASVMAGHSSTATTDKVYTHLAAKRLRKKILDLEESGDD